MSGEKVAEKEKVCLLGQQGDDSLDVADEAHVEHAGRLCRGRGFLMAERLTVRCCNTVEKPARGGDDDIDAAAQGGDLGIDADAAEDGGRSDGDVFTVGALSLPRPAWRVRGSAPGRERRAPWRPGTGRWHRWSGVAGWQGNPAVLPVPVWAVGHEVAAAQHGGDGLALDGRRVS